eukprot:COSAG01_NODE_19048_length_1034_cov_1.310160_1_plen_28_part_10
MEDLAESVLRHQHMVKPVFTFCGCKREG